MKAQAVFDAGSRARTANLFSLLVQRKQTKRKDARSTHRLEYTRPLRSLARAFLTNPGVAHNSGIYGLCPVNLLKQVRAYSPDWLRYSVSATGGVNLKPDGYATLYPSYIKCTTGLPPVGAAEHRSENRMKLTLV